MRQHFGDAVSFHTALGKGMAVFEASLAREVFAAPPDTFETIESVGAIFGERAVIATSGVLHKKQRKILNPPFHGARIKALLGTIQRVVKRHVDALTKPLRVGDVVKMTDITQAMTLDVILETVFGSNADDGRLDRGREVLIGITHGFNPAIITTKRLHKPWFPPWRKYLGVRAEFDAWVMSLVDERRKQGDLGEDLLGLFLSTRYDDGAPMSDAEIKDHLITLLLAGHETSAIAIAWAVYWMLREPSVLTRVRKEVAALGPACTAEQLARLPYLQAVASESLRIEPVVTDVVRRCRSPLTIRDWTVPAGDHIAVMIGSILNDERVFPKPNEFKPERFLDRSYHAGEFLPFGGGQRRCLGAAFAEAELAIAIATIACDLELELAEPSYVERSVRRNITMGPSHGVRVRVLGARPAVHETTRIAAAS